ncbi:MAG: hypothetical protein LC620_06605 [Halobacteriales archaeon]|nr:hypothetical protein [Halobacteriales archaeon]
MATAAFGLALLVFSADAYARADALASLGLGIMGTGLALGPFRRGERWAWGVLWFWPIFWLVHWLLDLPPGHDHVHQVVLLVLSGACLVGAVPTWTPETKAVG